MSVCEVRVCVLKSEREREKKKVNLVFPLLLSLSKIRRARRLLIFLHIGTYVRASERVFLFSKAMEKFSFLSLSAIPHGWRETGLRAYPNTLDSKGDVMCMLPCKRASCSFEDFFPLSPSLFPLSPSLFPLSLPSPSPHPLSWDEGGGGVGA